jgi:hypothetical protein
MRISERVPAIFPTAKQSPLGQGLFIIKASHSHLDTPYSVGLLWTSDQPIAETSTCPHTTLTTDGPPWPWRSSNFQSQQASYRRPTAWTPRPLRSAGICYTDRGLLWFSSVSLDNCRYTALKYAHVTAACYA